jgi:hypothetical protein
MDLRQIIPPYSLPQIPIAASVHTSSDNPGDGLTHGFGGLARTLLEFDAGWIYDVIPEVGSDLEVLLAQVYPSSKCLSYE